jgi:phosphate transport system permease protein
MTDVLPPPAKSIPSVQRVIRVSDASAQALVRKRYRSEWRFRAYGLAAIVFAGLFLVALLWSVMTTGFGAFFHHRVTLAVPVNTQTLDLPANPSPAQTGAGNFRGAVNEAFRAKFPDATSRDARRAVAALLSPNASDDLQQRLIANPALLGQTVTLPAMLSSNVDLYLKGKISAKDIERGGSLTQLDVDRVNRLKAEGSVASHFHWPFVSNGASREPESAGILGALVGTALTMLVTLVICLPLGVAAAVYLEEFAPKNRLTDIIEVNINNLAAVPSIIFGLLGLSIFLNWFDLPRSSALVGGLVLALLVLPTIIIASRAALKAVPPSIREAALGIGASKQQAVFHHVLPLAMPGIMTGTILGMAHALGETAPLILIGMVAFIVDVPGSVTTSATVLPVQIYQWSTFPEPAFQAKTAGGIIILLSFLFVMNGAAIWLRRRFERRW